MRTYVTNDGLVRWYALVYQPHHDHRGPAGKLIEVKCDVACPVDRSGRNGAGFVRLNGIGLHRLMASSALLHADPTVGLKAPWDTDRRRLMGRG